MEEEKLQLPVSSSAEKELMGNTRPQGRKYHVNLILNEKEDEDSGLAAKFCEAFLKRFDKPQTPVFYPPRDQHCGTSIFDVLPEMIDCSDYTVVILTEGFLKDSWLNFCQRMAFTQLIQTGRFIPIALGIGRDKVPSEIEGAKIKVLYFNKDFAEPLVWKLLKKTLFAIESQRSPTSEASSRKLLANPLYPAVRQYIKEVIPGKAEVGENDTLIQEAQTLSSNIEDVEFYGLTKDELLRVLVLLSMGIETHGKGDGIDLQRLECKLVKLFGSERVRSFKQLSSGLKLKTFLSCHPEWFEIESKENKCLVRAVETRYKKKGGKQASQGKSGEVMNTVLQQLPAPNTGLVIQSITQKADTALLETNAEDPPDINSPIQEMEISDLSCHQNNDEVKVSGISFFVGEQSHVTHEQQVTNCFTADQTDPLTLSRVRNMNTEGTHLSKDFEKVPMFSSREVQLVPNEETMSSETDECIPDAGSQLQSEPKLLKFETRWGGDSGCEEGKHNHNDSHSNFNLLFQRSPGPDLLFRNESFCKHDLDNLWIDIVSLWNTPSPGQSFIVVGVDVKSFPPHNLLGRTDFQHDAFYQNNFPENCFTSRPKFLYQEFQHESKIFGIFIIENAKGVGRPCIVKTVAELPKCWYPNQLWYRQGTLLKLCELQDPISSDIHQFFSTNSQKISNSTSPQQGSPYKDDIKYLQEAMAQFRKGHYILVIGPCRNHNYLEALTLVPWIMAFDFDTNSKETGVLSKCEDLFSKRNGFYLSSWGRLPSAVSERATQWCSVRGYSDYKPSLAVGDATDWFKKTRNGLDIFFNEIGKFALLSTVLKVLVIVGDDETILPYIQKFLQRFDEAMEVLSPKITLCLSQIPFEEPGRRAFQNISDDKVVHNIIQIPVEHVCLGIIDLLGPENKRKAIKYDLPTEDGTNCPGLTDKDAAWLREDFEVLYLTNPYDDEINEETMDEDTDNFYKGATLPWRAWYLWGPGHYDIERDTTSSALTMLQKYIQDGRSGIVTIYHNPGSGGSTFSQRLLWLLHKTVPCVELLRSVSTKDDVLTKIDFLYNKTGHKHVIILLDGEDENRAKQVSRVLARVMHIILLVQRYPLPVEGRRRNDQQMYLSGQVSPSEGLRLRAKYDPMCDTTEKKEQLLELTEDCRKHIPHYLFEFGLTTYLHEYRGVRTYVRGYLMLNQNPTKNILPWQKVLGYLSLVHYYGGGSVPSQFMASLLGKPENYLMSLDDLPKPAQQLVVQEETCSGTTQWRISHYYVAKEILEHFLNSNLDKAEDDRKRLSKRSKQNLASFAIDFLEYAGQKKFRGWFHSATIAYIISRTFTMREGIESSSADGSDGHHGHARWLSPLLNDIESLPPYTERLNVLLKLTESFPHNAMNYALLGRFYGHFRPNDQDLAEKCLDTALSICMGKSEKKTYELDDKKRHSLKMIYHMYGTIFLRRIQRLTNGLAGKGTNTPPQSNDPVDDKFHEELYTLFQFVESACWYYGKSREYAPVDEEPISYCFPIVGEINVRLHLCDFVKQHYSPKGIQEYLNCADGKEDIQAFIKDSVQAIDGLITEYNHVVVSECHERDFLYAVKWYDVVFKDLENVLQHWSGTDDMKTRRLKIAALKRCHSNGRGPTALDKIATEDHICQIVELYSRNIEEAHDMGFGFNSFNYERDFREWLFAIRHEYYPQVYEVEEVLSKVRVWNEYRHSPMSKFYLFVLNTLVGLGDDSRCGHTKNLLEAIRMQEEIKVLYRVVSKPRLPREWLGSKGPGFKCLLHGSQFKAEQGANSAHKSHQPDNRAVCRGTISSQNTNRRAGKIRMDTSSDIPLTLFFVPIKNGLHGKRFEYKRVEFHVAFTFDQGYEAYDVKELFRASCPKCNGSVEFSSLQKLQKCRRCGFMVPRQ